MLKPSIRERLGGHIYRILQGMKFLDSNLSCNSSIFSALILDTDMFGLIVIDIILGEMHSTLII